ncbi:MAG: S-adenosyl-methyltransferase [Flavobacteriaceae bacterium]|nr:S-adenosyl-methyltransferase [Flavobacteriaceae bacterium]
MIRKKIIGILKGEFLVGENALKNWKIYGSILLFFMVIIFMGHRYDKKVLYIVKIKKELREKRSELIDISSTLQKKKMESTVRKDVKAMGLFSSLSPPKIILIKDKI